MAETPSSSWTTCLGQPEQKYTARDVSTSLLLPPLPPSVYSRQRREDEEEDHGRDSLWWCCESG